MSIGLTGVLKGKVALVTGASRGIGQAIAFSLGEAGAVVIGTATRPEGALHITEAFAEKGITGRGICLDIADTLSVQAAVADMAEKEGMPHILINNAGVTADNLLLRMKEEEWSRVMNTNLTGVYRLTQACLRAMVKARWGRIVNVGSVVGTTGNAGQANYAAAKAGLIGFSKSLAKELGSRGITVNVVSPGFIETDMTHILPEETRKKLLDNIPLGRMGEPKDIAQAVVFLASEQASYITGETLHINGGMSMS
jgi:3-oxoacyl-[acyl-carrier protein] reductase